MGKWKFFGNRRGEADSIPPARPGANPAGIAAYRKILEQKNPSEEGGPPGLLRTGASSPEAARGGVASAPERSPGPPPEGRPLEKLSVLPGGEGKKDSKYRRVAKFLVLIGSEDASKVLAQLEPDQVEVISQEIALIRGITPEEAEEIFAEFRSLLASPYGYSGISQGGLGEARRILYAAYGPEKGEALLKKAVPDAVAAGLFKFLEDFSPEQLCFLFRDESPAAAALVLSRLSPALSAGVLARLTPERKLEIVRRIAKMGTTTTEMLERVAAALREKARHLGGSGQEDAPVDGINTLTEILKHSDLSLGDRILEELEDQDPELGKNLKERLYTLEDLVFADDRPVQVKLRSLADRDIALLLKGRSPAFAEKILGNISAARRAQVREESEIMGPAPRREVDAAAQEFLDWFRQGREDGKILLLNSDEVIL